MAEGLPCGSCGAPETAVIDSRPASDPVPSIRRRRRCEACGARFSTMEIVRDVDLSHLINLAAVPDRLRMPIRMLIAAASEGAVNV